MGLFLDLSFSEEVLQSVDVIDWWVSVALVV